MRFFVLFTLSLALSTSAFSATPAETCRKLLLRAFNRSFRSAEIAKIESGVTVKLNDPELREFVLITLHEDLFKLVQAKEKELGKELDASSLKELIETWVAPKMKELIEQKLSPKKLGDPAPHVFSMFERHPLVSGEILMFRIEPNLIHRFLGESVGYFSPGHGRPGLRTATLNLADKGENDKTGEKSYIHFQFNQTPALERFGKNVKDNEKIKTVFFASCGAGLGHPDVPAIPPVAVDLTMASGKSVIAPKGNLSYYFHPETKTHHFLVARGEMGMDPLDKDSAFRIFHPNKTSSDITFAEFIKTLAKPGEKVEYGVPDGVSHH